MLHSPISVDNATHYEWGAGCDGWHLLRAAGFAIIEERMAPGTAEARHWHARARQFFYVVDGALELEVEGEVHILPRRTGLEIPPGLAHQARNRGNEPVNFLVISSPPHQGDRRESDAPAT
jgi:mannose-6-phosphate isomerase-like protein (cupin superfamily)